VGSQGSDGASDGGDKANGFYPIRGPLTSSVDQRILNMSSDEKSREYDSGRIDKGVGQRWFKHI
jgi:hypothetical protein